MLKSNRLSHRISRIVYTIVSNERLPAELTREDVLIENITLAT